MSSPTQIFIAYSRKDSELMEKLRIHLRPLERARMAKIWYDGIIEAGSDWEKEIKTHLHSANVILLLISADFIDSDYCYDEEMTDALKKHEQNESKVIPIILRPCAWKYSPFAKLLVLPKDGKPVIEHEDYAFTEIVEAVAKICQGKKEDIKTNENGLILKGEIPSKLKPIDHYLKKIEPSSDTNKVEDNIPFFETEEAKETQAIVDSILSGEFLKNKVESNNENSFTDPRDGQTYKTVKLKDGRTWLAENLNYDLGSGCYFYDNNPINGQNYGRLYKLDSAHKSVPSGWRLPSKTDWESMIGAYGEWEGNFIRKVNATASPSLIEGGSSTFNALYGGLRTNLENFNYLGKSGNYWIGKENFSQNVIQFDRGLNQVVLTSKNIEYALSVRCIKDE